VSDVPELVGKGLLQQFRSCDTNPNTHTLVLVFACLNLGSAIAMAMNDGDGGESAVYGCWAIPLYFAWSATLDALKRPDGWGLRVLRYLSLGFPLLIPIYVSLAEPLGGLAILIVVAILLGLHSILTIGDGVRENFARQQAEIDREESLDDNEA